MKPNKSKLPHRMPKLARLPKIKTINDLLTRDDINGILADLDREKPNISDLIVIYFNKQTNKYCFQLTDNTFIDRATWLLETTKFDILNEALLEEE